MEQDIIKNLFSDGSFEIVADSTPWTSEWADRLVDYYSGTNLANNIFDVEFYDDITVNVEEGEIGVVLCGDGNDGEYQKYIYLSASVINNFTLDNFNYDVETGDELEHDEEDDEGGEE